MENLPGTDASGHAMPAVLLVKHQSTLETFFDAADHAAASGVRVPKV